MVSGELVMGEMDWWGGSLQMCAGLVAALRPAWPYRFFTKKTFVPQIFLLQMCGGLVAALQPAWIVPNFLLFPLNFCPSILVATLQPTWIVPNLLQHKAGRVLSIRQLLYSMILALVFQF